MSYSVSIINQSSKVAVTDVAQTVAAIQQQLTEDVAPIWGAVPMMAVGGDGVRAFVVDSMPEAPGALGYHAEDSKGAFIKVLVADGYDWRTTMSHEILELALDYAANLWADMPDGSDVARELCDPVEADTYTRNGVPVSNFVTPSWFNPQGKYKFDFMAKLAAPFTMSPGGYMIVRSEPGQVTQQLGSVVKLTKKLSLVFHPDYPEAKKPGKVFKALRRVRA